MAIRFGNETKPLTLVDLPAIIESHRTFNSATYYKSGDISQVSHLHESLNFAAYSTLFFFYFFF